jgi:hypothetical protein
MYKTLGSTHTHTHTHTRFIKLSPQKHVSLQFQMKTVHLWLVYVPRNLPVPWLLCLYLKASFFNNSNLCLPSLNKDVYAVLLESSLCVFIHHGKMTAYRLPGGTWQANPLCNERKPDSEHLIQLFLSHLCSLLDANVHCLPCCRFTAIWMATLYSSQIYSIAD